METSGNTITDTDQYSNISSLIRKLGHELEEIRTRSLEMILSKLDHSVITEYDLVQHKQLFIKLFEWFNFPSITHKDKILDLLLRFSKNKSAVRHIQEIGGMQFLTALKLDIGSQDIKGKIEEIIENLFQTSIELKDENHHQNGSQSSNMTTTTMSSAATTLQSFSTLKLDSFREINVRNQSIFDSQIFDNYTTQSINSNDMSSNMKFMLNEIDLNETTPQSGIFYWITLNSFDRNFLNTTLNTLRSNDLKKIKSYCAFLQNVVFSDFPTELFLQRPEIIKTLLNLLQTTSDIDLFAAIVSCLNVFCVKLRKRILYIKDPSTFCVKDFYGENFELSRNYEQTHRGKQNENANENHNGQLTDRASINISVYSHHSGGTLISTIKSSTASSIINGNEKKANRERIDENFCQDLQETINTMLCESNREINETDLNEKDRLKKEQMPIYMFSLKLFDILLDNLTKSTALLGSMFEILSSLVAILDETKNEWTSLKISDSVMSLFQKINHYLKLWYTKELSPYNRTVYIYLCNLLSSFINLMHSTNDTSLVLPNELSETIFLIINDICLNEVYGDQYTTLLCPILSYMEPRMYDIYLLSSHICDSLNAACNFLIGYENNSMQAGELLLLAKQSLNCLDYHLCKLIPEKVVGLCSSLVFDVNNLSENFQFKNEIESLMCICMMNENEYIRIETYNEIFKIIKACLNVHVAAELNSQRYKKLKFLLINKIFYEFVTYGLFDSCIKVKEYTHAILQYLLNCDLLVSNEFFAQLNTLITAYMPFIQCHASQLDKLGQMIIQLTDDTKDQLTVDKQHFLSSIEKFKCSLRYLYSKDKNLRKIGYRQSIGYIIKDNKLETDNSINLFYKNLNDLYLHYPPDTYADVLVQLKRQKSFQEHDQEAIFQVENLLKIYNIFSSETVDMDIKRSACEQLAIMITDSTLHKAFINLGGLDYCLNLLKKSEKEVSIEAEANQTNETTFVLLASCLTCIANIFYWNKDIRYAYSNDVYFYKLMFKYMIVYNSRQTKHINSSQLQSVQEDLASIIFLLINHQLSCIDAKYDLKTKKFQLNFNLCKKFHQPFEIVEITKRDLTLNSENLNVKFNRVLSEFNNRKNVKEILCEKFRIYWNIKWHNGNVNNLIDDLLHNKHVNSKMHIEFSENLILTENDRQLLLTTNQMYLLTDLLNKFETVNTHELALNLLDHIKLVFLVKSPGLNLSQLNWYTSFNRFLSIIPKSCTDQALYTRIYKTINKIFEYLYVNLDSGQNQPSIDLYNWTLNLINHNNSNVDIGQALDDPQAIQPQQQNCFINLFKYFLDNYETDELQISIHLNTLIDFIKNSFQYFNNNNTSDHTAELVASKKTVRQQSPSLLIYSNEILNYCMQHMKKSCETYNLNKLQHLLDIYKILLYHYVNDVNLQIQLVKCLIQIINSFHVGRGGLSLSFMGNSIIKSSLLCLLHILRNLMLNDNQPNKVDVLKYFVCVKDEQGALSGCTWLAPLLLHREPEIRSMSFSLTSLIATTAYGRNKLLTYQNGVWSISFSVLLNHHEASIVRSQACALLINLTQSMINEDENSISYTALQLMLHEHNFYPELANLLTSFYPYDEYTYDKILMQNQNTTRTDMNLYGNDQIDLSITSPQLISSICQLLYNLSILLSDETILNVNNNGIMRLLLNFVKPKLINQSSHKNQFYLIDMLKTICRYCMLCCVLEKNCVVMLVSEEKFLSDLIECFSIDSNKGNLKYLYTIIFDLLSLFMNFDDSAVVNQIVNSLLKRWSSITKYLIELIEIETTNSDLLENTLRFYSIYLSKISQMNNPKLPDSISFLYDFNEKQNGGVALGARFCELLIKQFDKYCLSETVSNLKMSVFNTLKTLLAFSVEAKNFAVENGLIESLVDQLKHINTKLSIKSLNVKSNQKENSYIIDIRQIFLILKSLMLNSVEIKNEINKSNLIGILHSLWCWIIQDTTLLQSTLSMLCTFTANNKNGINLIVQNNYSTTLIMQTTSNSAGAGAVCLLQLVLKILSKSTTKYPIQKYAFCILTNCVAVNECRAILWKSSILQDFTNEMQQKTNTKPNYKKEKLWLQLLTALSFTSDGQNYFMKSDGFWNSIIKCMGYTTTVDLQYYCLLILRNLAFNQSNKSKLLSNADYLNVILANLKNKEEKFRKLSISTLEILLYDYQKAKVVLRNANVLNYIVDLHEYYKNVNDTQTLATLKHIHKLLNDF